MTKQSSVSAGHIKDELFFFEDIAKFFAGKGRRDTFQVLTSQSCTDIDLEKLFIFLDRTTSRTGQQYLYDLLRSIPFSSPLKEHADIREAFSGNPPLRKKVRKALSSLTQTEAYTLPSLFQGECRTMRRGYVALLYVLRFLPLLFLLLLLFFQWGGAVVGLIAALTVNMAVHYVNKFRGVEYMTSVPQLFKLTKTARKLAALPELKSIAGDIPAALKVLQPLQRKFFFLHLETKIDSDVTALVWMLVELQHIFFLTEPLSFAQAMDILKDKKEEIEKVYSFVGLTDTLLSTAYLTEGLPYFCRLEYTVVEETFRASKLYHPLIPDCVGNDLSLRGKSMLLTGSNMSGKTTFIRTVMINALTAQTLDLCFAESFALRGPTEIHSSVMLTDNLSEGRSFYMEEVSQIKEMLERSRNGRYNFFMLDEIFKGTNTTERIAAAKAVLSYLVATGSNTVFVSTHDIELADLLAGTYELYNFSETIENDTLSFDYKLKPGKLTRRNAIRILELCRYPPEVIDQAYRIADKDGGVPSLLNTPRLRSQE